MSKQFQGILVVFFEDAERHGQGTANINLPHGFYDLEDTIAEFDGPLGYRKAWKIDQAIGSNEDPRSILSFIHENGEQPIRAVMLKTYDADTEKMIYLASSQTPDYMQEAIVSEDTASRINSLLKSYKRSHSAF